MSDLTLNTHTLMYNINDEKRRRILRVVLVNLKIKNKNLEKKSENILKTLKKLQKDKCKTIKRFADYGK